MSRMYPQLDSRKKNALAKESEYGVMGIKTPLLDVSAKAEEVWGPALGGREKEDSMMIMTGTAERYKDMHEVGTAITEKIKQRDYEGIADDYRKAKQFADETKRLVESLGSTSPTDSQIFQILLAGRVWHDIERQIREFKDDVSKKLGSIPNISSRADVAAPQDQHMELIGILLELGVDENPIWTWLENRYSYLKNKIQMTSDRSKIAIEVSRRRLANGETDCRGSTNFNGLWGHHRALGADTFIPERNAFS
jgi:exocyst complex component 2